MTIDERVRNALCCVTEEHHHLGPTILPHFFTIGRPPSHLPPRPLPAAQPSFLLPYSDSSCRYTSLQVPSAGLPPSAGLTAPPVCSESRQIFQWWPSIQGFMTTRTDSNQHRQMVQRVPGRPKNLTGILQASSSCGTPKDPACKLQSPSFQQAKPPAGSLTSLLFCCRVTHCTMFNHSLQTSRWSQSPTNQHFVSPCALIAEPILIFLCHSPNLIKIPSGTPEAPAIPPEMAGRDKVCFYLRTDLNA